MHYYKLLFLIFQILNFCNGEVNHERNVKLLNGFIDFYNTLPDRIYTCEEGTLDYVEKVDENTFKIRAILKVKDVTKHLKCTCTVQDLEAGVTVLNNVYQCEEQNTENNEEAVTEQYKPVQLDNEVQTNTAVTSGEQFIAIPRQEPAVRCEGCASHVNPQAAGVSELALLGIRHLDRHESNIKHSLKTVVDVERQVQVVNGVRYILTLLVDFNDCTDIINEQCYSTKPCKISILEKPWVKLSTGEKYRAILANNCTENWLFGDDGEILNDNADNKDSNKINDISNNNNAGDDSIKVVHTQEVQSLQNTEKSLTDDQIKSIEEQIVRHKELVQDDDKHQAEISTTKFEKINENIVKEEAKLNEKSVGPKDNTFRIPLSQDKKKAVDDLINFFNLYGFGSDQVYDRTLRIKRSYERELESVSLAEKYESLQNALNSGKYLYNLAQSMVDYLNEMDLEVKTRVLSEVIKAEEEIVNYQHFFYLQAHVIIPSEKVDCSPKDTIAKICNGVIDGTDKVNPRVLIAFCYSIQEETELHKIKNVPLNDPVLLKLVQEGTKKIEAESSKENAIIIKRIIGANTKKAAGKLTKLTVVLNYLNCAKNTPLNLRRNCKILEHLGSNVCEMIIHEKNVFRQRQITYTCIQRPVEGSFSYHKERNTQSTDDLQVIQMAQEALQYLEAQSNRNNKQKIISIISVSTELNAGLLTDIEFIVGYTQCTNDDIGIDLNTCKILPNEPVRKCKAHIWDRTWIEDGRAIDVNCEDNSNTNDVNGILKDRKKRSLLFVGGKEHQDVNDVQYKSLAEESLLKFMQSSENRQHYNIVQIIRASVQVVSGRITRIEFIVSPTNCVLNNEGQVSSDICNVVDTSDITTCKSVIFEKPWLNKKQIEVTCDRKDRKRRGIILGGLKKMNPTDLKYRQLADQSFEKYLEISGCSQPNNRVIRVEKVTEQIVAGTITRLHFVVFTNYENSGDTIKCYSEVWDRPWLKKTEIDVRCNIDNQKHRAKRQLAGGLKEQDPNDSHYKQLAEESLQKYLQTSGNSKPHRVVSIEKVHTQVVSGTKTYLDFTVTSTTDPSGEVIKCHSVVWEQPWLKKKEVDVSCHIDNKQHRAKRHSAGGLKEQDPNDSRYKQLAEESLQKYLQTSGNSKPHRVVSIEKVHTQVVSGTKTYLDFTVTSTTDPSGEVIKCHSVVWEKPWLKKKEVDVSCHIDNKQHRAKRHSAGGLKEQDPNDSRYKQLAEESLQKYLQTSGNSKPHRVVSIEKVHTQVVSGTKTYLDFTVTPTTDPSEDVIKCHSEVWEQRWLKKKEVDVSCHIDNKQHRAKRQSAGGLKEQDPNDSRYKQLAEESLQKYLRTSGSSKPHRVVSIEKVHTQVVSGTKTYLDFTVTSTTDPSGDVIKCHSEVWEQSWSNKKEIDVNCKIADQKNRDKREIIYKKGRNSMVQDPTKRQFMVLAQDSLKEYGRLKKSKFVHKVVEVKRVVTKVVSGMIYDIDFSAVPTTCSMVLSDMSRCKQRAHSDLLYCNTNIWSQPWKNKKQIKVSCNPRRKKLSTERGDKVTNKLGSREKRQTIDDEDYIDEDLRYYYAERAMQQLNQESQTNNLYKLVTIHTTQNSVHMGANMIRMFIEIAPTFCLRHADENDLQNCEEMDGLNHKLCLARMWPSPDDELAIQSVNVVCDDDSNFASITGLSMTQLLIASLKQLESSHDQKYKLVHLGEPHLVPNLDLNIPTTLSFIVGFTNCTKDVDLNRNRYQCFIEENKGTKPCTSFIWFVPNSREINQISVTCREPGTRRKRSVPLSAENATTDDLEIQKFVQQSLEKLEMSSIHRYKQRVLLINSYSTKITTGRVTTIDFDVGYTSCLKYEWIDDVTTCEFLEHLPRRHCVSKIYERLWLQNGQNIEVHCQDDETPLEAHIEFESAEMAMELAKQSLKHIEAKYPHPRKQKVVRIFSLDKQVVAGIHYRMKIEVGFTNCTALSAQTACKLVKDEGINRFCRVNVWLRPWTDHPPNFRVTCDYQETATADVYHHIQAEHLFYDFITTYGPDYLNDHNEMRKRFDIFKDNVKRIHEMNIHERGTATYGVTRFADLTYEEFSNKYMGLKPSLLNHNEMPMRKAEIPKSDIPATFDWRDFNTVTEVKDQGSCGSCWAFSVTGNIEGQWKLHTGNLVSLSEQELVDCDKLDQGCNGGLPDNAYRAIEQLGGLEQESDYPYEGADDKCVFNKTLSKVQISSAVNISSNETDMAKWLVHNGPISIGINANAMQFYMGGISHPWRMLCNPSNLDHGVLLVGYGSKDYPLFHKKLPYWTIKNSWGKSWGEQGYYRVFRGDGTCGVNQMASSAVI